MPRAISQVFQFETKQKGDVRKIERGFDDLEQEIEEFGDSSREASDDSEALEKGLFSLGGAADVAKVAIGNLIAGGIDRAIGGAADFAGEIMDINSAMNRFEGQTGITGDALDAYKKSAQRLFTKGFGENFDDTVRAMAEVQRQTDLNGHALETTTRRALVFSETFDKDVTESIMTAQNMAKVFGNDAAENFDILAGAIQQTGDPAGDMMDTFNEYARNFEEMGFDQLDMLNLLNQGLQAGAYNTDVIADGMREYQIRLKDGSADLALWKLGLDGVNMEYKRGERDAASMFELIMGELRDIEDPIKRNQIGVELFGSKWEDVGEAAFLALDPTSNTLEDLGDSMDTAEKAMTRGLGPAWERFNRKVKVGLANALGPFIEKGLILATEWLDKAATGVSQFIEVFSEIGFYSSEMNETFQLIFGQDAGKRIYRFFETIAHGIDTLVDGFNSIKKAFDEGGLAGVGDLLRGWIEGIDWGAIPGKLGDILKSLLASAVPIANTIYEKVIQPVVDYLKTDVDWGAIPGKLTDVLQNLLTSATSIASTVYEDVIKPVIDYLKEIDWGEVAGKLADLYLKFLRMEMAYASWYYEHIIKPVVDYLKDINWGEVAGKLKELYSKFLVMATPISTYVYEQAIKPIIDYLKEINWSEVAGRLKELYLKFLSMELAIGNWVYNHVIKPVIDYLKEIDWSEVAGKLADLYLKFLHMEMAVGTWVYNHVIRPVIDYLKGIDWGEVAGKLGDLMEKLLTGPKTVTDWLIEKVWTPLTTGLGDSTEIQNVFTKAGEVAGQILKGLASGIGSIASWIKTNVMTAIVNALSGGGGGGRGGGGGGSVLDSGVNIGLSILSGIASAFFNLVSWIATNIIDPFIIGLTGESAAGNLLKLTGAGIGLGGKIISGIDQAFVAITDWVNNHIISPLTSAVTDNLTAIFDAGKDLGQGILDGLLEILKALPRELIQLINDAIPNEIKIDTKWLGSVSIDIDDNPIPLPEFKTGGVMQGVGITGEAGAELAFANQPTAILSHKKSVSALQDAFGLPTAQNGGGVENHYHFYGDFNLPQVKTAKQFLKDLEQEAQHQNKTLTAKRGMT